MQRTAYSWLAKHKANQGFTLIELMVTIAIAAILLTVGIPSMAKFITDTRVSASVNGFVGAMSMARSEAIKRGRLVTICRSVNAESGTTGCTGGGDWSSGWLVYVENSSSSNIGAYDTAEEVIFRQGALPSSLTVSTAVNAITFNGSGEPIGGFASAGFNFNASGDFARQICIARSGRVKVIRDATVCP